MKRMKHVNGRKRQAFRNFYVRNSQKLLGVSPGPVTELNYLFPKNFKTRVASRQKLSEAQEFSFSTPDGVFRHCFDATEIVTLQNAVIDTQFNHIYAITNSGDLVFLNESSDWSPTQISQVFKIDKSLTNTTDLDVTLGLGLNGYFHLVTEDLSRLSLLGGKHRVIQYSESPDHVFEILKGMNLEVLASPKLIAVNSLVFVTHGSDLGYLNSWQLQALKNVSGGVVRAISCDRFYISRTLTRRSPAFELELQTKLESLGFSILHLENLTFYQQREVLSAAKIIVGTHGAGLTGAMWAEKPLLIELMDETYVNRCFEWQTLMLGGRYERIEYKSKVANSDSIFAAINEILSEV